MEKQRFSAASYQNEVNRRVPKSRTVLFCLKAFWVGGLICCVGQAVQDLLEYCFVLTQDQLSASTAIILVFFGALLTGLGVYDKIGAYAGAGSVVPITGFANSVVAPAIEFKPEGLVMGVAAKMFNIAGPVIVYGISTSIVYGIILFLFGAA